MKYLYINNYLYINEEYAHQIILKLDKQLEHIDDPEVYEDIDEIIRKLSDNSPDSLDNILKNKSLYHGDALLLLDNAILQIENP